METIPAKTIVTPAKGGSQWFGIDYNMNIYRGCCHGCIYCDSRSDCYHIQEFDRVRAKANALEVIRNDLRRKVRTGVVGTGSMSDPYNPYEEHEELTRHGLELLSAYGFGVSIATKSTLVTRDIDLLQEIGRESPVIVQLTITTPHDPLSKKVEPHAPPSSQRLAALEQLAQAGVFAGVLLMPVLPFLEDRPEDIRLLVDRAADAGARFVYAGMGMTMREGQRDYFYQQLEEQFPGQGLPARYRQRYGSRYNCTIPQAKALWETFVQACDRRGLLYRMPEIIGAYKLGYENEQLRFF